MPLSHTGFTDSINMLNLGESIDHRVMEPTTVSGSYIERFPIEIRHRIYDFILALNNKSEVKEMMDEFMAAKNNEDALMEYEDDQMENEDDQMDSEDDQMDNDDSSAKSSEEDESDGESATEAEIEEAINIWRIRTQRKKPGVFRFTLKNSRGDLMDGVHLTYERVAISSETNFFSQPIMLVSKKISIEILTLVAPTRMFYAVDPRELDLFAQKLNDYYNVLGPTALQLQTPFLPLSFEVNMDPGHRLLDNEWSTCVGAHGYGLLWHFEQWFVALEKLRLNERILLTFTKIWRDFRTLRRLSIKYELSTNKAVLCRFDPQDTPYADWEFCCRQTEAAVANTTHPSSFNLSQKEVSRLEEHGCRGFFRRLGKPYHWELYDRYDHITSETSYDDGSRFEIFTCQEASHARIEGLAFRANLNITVLGTSPSFLSICATIRELWSCFSSLAFILWRSSQERIKDADSGPEEWSEEEGGLSEGHEDDEEGSVKAAGEKGNSVSDKEGDVNNGDVGEDEAEDEMDDSSVLAAPVDKGHGARSSPETFL
ncbi:hypothetical protein GLAREA_11193 [Glarea lozoyensis ATCC 20868]|uniref:Uncharacterized protein n=1 Tax=Glarea lozoyensis (strain ATCC 20868 / MF5171) TaxID=1116229 RepID=S3DEF1_GLAL2|nr:uncharacterized protein GLAREA_11193 [Glarea lozoyensis ATCC 20868]EPE35494.1 hypothetical protein GLAREA_11193 [Glarea lozoyensis ATCC 20868]